MSEGFDRLPPRDIAAEAAVLGAVMVDENALAEAVDQLRPEDFFREPHGQIWSAIRHLWDTNRDVTEITVAHVLADRDQLAAVGGQSYLADLVHRVPPTVVVASYAEYIRRAAMARDIISEASHLVEAAYRPDGDLEDTVHRAYLRVADILRGGSGESARLLSDIADNDYVAEAEAWLESPTRLTGLPTGIERLDRLIGGWQAGGLHVVGGATSVGKTQFGLHVAQQAALQDAHVLLFTTEMSAFEIRRRFEAMASGVNPVFVTLSGRATDEQSRRWRQGMADVNRYPVRVQPGSLTTDRLVSTTRRLNRSWGVDLVVVDHLHMVRVPGLTGRDRVGEIEHVTRTLKDLAEDERVPLVSLAHVNRDGQRAANTQTPGDRRWLQLSDLHNASSIERDANVVIFLDPATYGPLDPKDTHEGWYPLSKAELDARGINDRDINVRCYLAKSRNGITGHWFMERRWSQGGRWLEKAERRTA